ncbi:MAG TPA: ABC transporter ATP-binding protein [Thermoanaerobaculia bacterium]|nr:ABC transporter ATP-binding protein [Thermoanaerobaculia bacterium]
MTLLSVRSLTKTFRGEDGPRAAVSNLDFDLDCGEILAFLGPNGAGKTTTIKMIAALVKPDHGRVLIDGEDPQCHSQCLSKIGAILEGNRNLYWRLTPIENIEYFAGIRGIPRKKARSEGETLLERFGLADRMRSPVFKLSRGMQQKVAIIISLVHRPRLLLLDEPSLGLDVEAANDMNEIIQQLAGAGIGVLLTTHQLALAEKLAQNVLIIRNGRKVLHCPLHEALRETNRRNHTISLLAPLTDVQHSHLRILGAQLQSSTVTFSGDSAVLYAVLDLLRPLEINEIRTSARTLDDVFMEIARHAQPAC